MIKLREDFRDKLVYSKSFCIKRESVMRLTEKQKRVLAACAHDADQTVPQIQKKSGVRGNTIRTTLARLEDTEVIRYYPLINVYPLGYTAYSVFFSLQSKKKLKTPLISLIKNSSNVSWAAELGGSYQYVVSVLAKQPEEVMHFFDTLSSKLGHVVQKKSIGAQLSYSILPAHYFLKGQQYKTPVSWGPTGTFVEIDDLDRIILSGLIHLNYSSKRQLSRMVNIPVSTLDVRIKKLKEKGILSGFVYLINSPVLGMHVYKLLVSVSGHQEKLKEKLFDFCSKSWPVTTFIQSLGDWDYEIGIEVFDSQEVIEFSEELENAFPEIISHIEVLPHFRDLKTACYPFVHFSDSAMNTQKKISRAASAAMAVEF